MHVCVKNQSISQTLCSIHRTDLNFVRQKCLESLFGNVGPPAWYITVYILHCVVSGSVSLLFTCDLITSCLFVFNQTWVVVFLFVF